MSKKRTNIQKLKSRVISGIKLRRTFNGTYIEFYSKAGIRLFMVEEMHLFDGSGNWFEGTEELPVSEPV